MKKILVPIDGSDASRAAAETAVELAKNCGSEITFLTVVEIRHEFVFANYSDHALMGPDYLEIRENLLRMDTENSTRMLDKVVESLDCAGLKTGKTVVTGDPYAQIVNTAAEGEYDMIVMGHRGLNPLKRLFIGSVAKKVVDDSPCSVLIVK